MANDHAKDGQDDDEKMVEDVDHELTKNFKRAKNVYWLKYDFQAVCQEEKWELHKDCLLFRVEVSILAHLFQRFVQVQDYDTIYDRQDQISDDERHRYCLWTLFFVHYNKRNHYDSGYIQKYQRDRHNLDYALPLLCLINCDELEDGTNRHREEEHCSRY